MNSFQNVFLQICEIFVVNVTDFGLMDSSSDTPEAGFVLAFTGNCLT